MLFQEYYPKIISTFVSIIVYFIAKQMTYKIIIEFSKRSQLKETRALVVIRLFNILFLLLFVIIVFTIWGVKAENIYITFTSVFTIIGVAMFAQWSILSNVTASVLLFFFFPFKIGDCIKIQDKDFPVEAHISEIKAFYTLLITKEGQYISYPNNLLIQKGIIILKNNCSEDNIT